MKRKSRTRAQRLAIFDRDNGICWRCEQKIQVGQPWELGHIIALSCGGEDTDENVAPEHKSCNARDAHETTTPRAAKIKRVRAKHVGIRKRSGFRGWRKFNGDPVWND